MHKPHIIDGRSIANQVVSEVKKDVEELASKGVIPGLAVIIAGDNPMSKLYVQRKREKAEAVGINSFVYEYTNDITAKELKQKISELNSDNSVHAILVQLPLPKHIDAIDTINMINPSKDVDGFTIENTGKLIMMRDGLFPCTPQGCLHLIKSVEPNIRGMNAVVIGKSNVVGRPMSNVLLNEECSVTVLHLKSRDLPSITRNADILVSAAGAPGLVTREWVNNKMILIDVGITRVVKNGKTRLVGDVDFDGVKDIVRAITPVPGGVGPMTIAYLLKNTVKAAKLQRI